MSECSNCLEEYSFSTLSDFCSRDCEQEFELEFQPIILERA